MTEHFVVTIDPKGTAVVVHSRQRAAELVRGKLDALTDADKTQFREFIEGRRHTLCICKWEWTADSHGRSMGWAHYLYASPCSIEE